MDMDPPQDRFSAYPVDLCSIVQSGLVLIWYLACQYESLSRREWLHVQQKARASREILAQGGRGQKCGWGLFRRDA
jgi:hypothetical protein